MLLWLDGGGLDLDELVARLGSGDVVVGPLPLVFYFDAFLRGAVSPAEVLARERVGALLVEDRHLDGEFFEGWRVGGAVEVAAGHLVDGLEDGVHRHVEFFAVDAVGDEDLDFDLAVGGAELDVAAVGDTALFGELMRDLDEGAGGHALDAGGAIGHASLLEVFEETAVVEVEVELGGGLLRGFDPLDGIELCFAVVERKFFEEEDGRVFSIFRDGPLQGAVAFEAFVGHAGEEGR